MQYVSGLIPNTLILLSCRLFVDVSLIAPNFFSSSWTIRKSFLSHIDHFLLRFCFILCIFFFLVVEKEWNVVKNFLFKILILKKNDKFSIKIGKSESIILNDLLEIFMSLDEKRWNKVDNKLSVLSNTAKNIRVEEVMD